MIWPFNAVCGCFTDTAVLRANCLPNTKDATAHTARLQASTCGQLPAANTPNGLTPPQTADDEYLLATIVDAVAVGGDLGMG